MPEYGLEEVLDDVIPNWNTRMEANPPGNTLGRELRHIMEDSKSIFGKSVYSNELAHKLRWSSTFNTDYVDRNTPRASTAPGCHMQAKEDFGNIAGMSAARHHYATFQGWKVPERVTTGDGSRRSSRSMRSSREGGRRSQNLATQPQLPQIQNLSLSPRLEKPKSAIPSTPRLNNGLAKLTIGNDCNEQAANKIQASPRYPKGFRIYELLSRYYSPCSSADQWIQRASPDERQLIEKALQVMAPNNKSKSYVNQTIDSWLKDATAAEKLVALDFFQTAGLQLAGNNPELKERINNVTARLMRGRVHPGVLPTPDPDVDRRFRYLSLISPEARDKKWMQQTWHHLPAYKDTNPVINSSAMFTHPQKAMKTHYIIHPDLG